MTKRLGWRWIAALISCGALGLAACSKASGCSTDSDCAAGEICGCADQVCQPVPSCPDGERLCDDGIDGGCSSVCTDIQTNQNCGGCGYVCGAGTACVADGGELPACQAL